MDKRKTNDRLNVLQDTLINIIRKRKISYNEYFKMIYDQLYKSCEYANDSSIRSVCGSIIRGTLGYTKLTYFKFEFIMRQVLNEEIIENDEIRHMRLLGRGGIDIRGQRFGRLIATEIIAGDNSQLLWKCKCDYGSEPIVNGYRLRNGSTQSCGCYRIDLSRQRNRIHGMTNTREFKTWDGMKQRCYNQNDRHYSDYGGRGIIVCDRWLESFMNFYEDMGDKPEGMSIDRIDVNRNYEPDNCKWATTRDQNNNMRHTLRFDDGMPLGTFANDNHISYHNALRWFNQGLTKEEMLVRYSKIGSNCCKFDDGTPIAELINQHDLNYHKVWLLFKKGYTKEQILEEFNITLAENIDTE